jgi:hypothetical protein
LLASTSLAQARSELEKSSIKAATDCVAAAALKNPIITTLYREDRLDEVTDWIVLQSSACDNPLRAMRLLHDRLYGQGTGRTFLRGDYLADLPRAVRERIRVEVARRGLESPELRRSYVLAPSEPPSSPNSQLKSGDKLKVEGVGPNDVLNMREYATTNSLIYLGETQGDWILVRYGNHAEGWVNRYFVVRLTTPGRHLQ